MLSSSCVTSTSYISNDSNVSHATPVPHCNAYFRRRVMHSKRLWKVTKTDRGKEVLGCLQWGNALCLPGNQRVSRPLRSHQPSDSSPLFRGKSILDLPWILVWA